MSGSWKVAYADFVTAMMAFFLLMWILNMTPPESKKGLAAYFSGEGTFESSNVSPVSNNPFIQSTDKLDMRDLKITETERAHYAIAQRLKSMLMSDAIPQNATGISADDVGVLLRVNNASFYKPGSAELTDAGKKVMERVIDLLREYNLYAVIRGHADPLELINTDTFASNWELSGARAAAVAHYLTQNNIKATRIRAVGYADTRPLEPGISPESVAKNRRVELYFHRPEVMSYGVMY